MEATIAASVPPTQTTTLPAQTSLMKNNTIRKNITADNEASNTSVGADGSTSKKFEATRDFEEKQQQRPKTTLAPTQKFWQKASSIAPTSPQQTLPAVQDFLQKAYETVQRSQQNTAIASERSHQKAFSSQPSPIIATALVQRSMQSVFIGTPLIPKVATAAPLPFQQASSPVVTAQRSHFRNLTVVQGSLPKAEAAMVPIPDKSTADRTQLPMMKSENTLSTPSPQTSKTKMSSESPSTQSEQTPEDSPIKQGTSRVAQTFLSSKAAQKGRIENGPQTQKKIGPRSPQSQAGGSARPNGGRRPRDPEPEGDPKRMVLVTGFPPYAQISDLLRVLLPIGPCRIDKCRNRLAVVIFETEEAAQNAIKATNELCIYGDFLEIKPYTNARDADELFRAYKKVIPTEKGQDIIQPDKIDLSGDFYQQLENIQNAIRLTSEQLEAVNRLYVDLETVLQQEWPG